MKNSIRNVAVIAALLLVSMSVQAGLLASSVAGDTVVYHTIEESVTGNGTYGTPTVATGSDALDFDPLGLNVQSSGGGFNFNNAQLNFGITAKDGQAIDYVEFAELGDYILSGAGGTSATYADVTANFFVDIEELDGGLTPIVAPISYTTGPINFANVALPGDAGFLIGWGGLITLDIDAIVAASGQSYISGASKISISLNNAMVAQSEAGTTSFIAKKDADGFTVTSEVIPEPASAVLLIATASGLVFVRRRFIG